MNTIRPADLQRLLATDQPLEIVDIRPLVDFDHAHIDGSHWLPSPEISPQAVLLSRQLLASEPLYLISESGALAWLSASDLEHTGLDNLVVLAGGWGQRSGLTRDN